MFNNLIDQKLSLGVLNSLILTGIIAIAYLVSRFIIKKKINNHNKAKSYILRAFYIIIIVYAILFIRIWIDGLSSIFTVLGLVGAGLVISNKENIMNLIGGLIILWRGLFTESNYIKIRTHEGYVAKLGPLYFTLYYKYDKTTKSYSGQITRIPNGWVITDAITNYSQSIVLIDDHLTFKISCEKDYPLLIEGSKKILDQTLISYCKKSDICIKNSNIEKNILESSNVSIKPDNEHSDHICVELKYKGVYFDLEKIKDKLSIEITKLIFNRKTD